MNRKVLIILISSLIVFITSYIIITLFRGTDIWEFISSILIELIGAVLTILIINKILELPQKKVFERVKKILGVYITSTFEMIFGQYGFSEEFEFSQEKLRGIKSQEKRIRIMQTIYDSVEKTEFKQKICNCDDKTIEHLYKDIKWMKKWLKDFKKYYEQILNVEQVGFLTDGYESIRIAEYRLVNYLNENKVSENNAIKSVYTKFMKESSVQNLENFLDNIFLLYTAFNSDFLEIAISMIKKWWHSIDDQLIKL